MLKLELEINELDYKALVEYLLPLMGDQLRGSGNPLGMLLSNGMSAGMAKRILDTVPRQQVDALIADVINSNNTRLAGKIEETAEQNHIGIKVNSIHATAK